MVSLSAGFSRQVAAEKKPICGPIFVQVKRTKIIDRSKQALCRYAVDLYDGESTLENVKLHHTLNELVTPTDSNNFRTAKLIRRNAVICVKKIEKEKGTGAIILREMEVKFRPDSPEVASLIVDVGQVAAAGGKNIPKRNGSETEIKWKMIKLTALKYKFVRQH